MKSGVDAKPLSIEFGLLSLLSLGVGKLYLINDCVHGCIFAACTMVGFFSVKLTHSSDSTFESQAKTKSLK